MQTNNVNKTTHGKWFGKSKLYDPSTNEPYMTRWFIGNLRLHQMHQGDLQRDMHDHPWWFVTFPFRSYVEEILIYRGGMYQKELNVVKAWRFHFRKARYTHRILGPDFGDFNGLVYRRLFANGSFDTCFDEHGITAKSRRIWTLVFRGKVKQKWGFWEVVDRARNGYWIPAKVYFTGLGIGYEEGSTSEMPENRDRRPETEGN